MKYFKYYVVLIVLVVGSHPQRAISQSLLKKYYHKILADTVTSKPNGYIVSPLIFYTPETHLAFGITSVFYTRFPKRDKEYRPSSIHPFVGYTQNKQFFAEVPFQLFFKREKYYLYGEVDFYNYPYRYFGAGNHTQPYNEYALYNAVDPSCSLSVIRKVAKPLYVGVRYNFDYYKITILNDDHHLFSPNTTGLKGGVNNGMGLMALYDTRNNVFATTKGSYLEFMSVFNAKYTLSNYTYQWYVMDLRKFITLSPLKKNIIALQYYINVMTGNAPFYQLAMLGGEHRMRGYYEGTYRDKNYTTAQAEYRSGFWKNRFGFAAFAGTGIVFDSFKTIDLFYLKPSLGGGLRFKFNRKENLHLRIDYAVGYKSSGLYFVLNEAF